MTPYEALMTAPRAEQAALWMEQCTRCEDVQRQVLADILARAQDTVVGRRYDFAALDSVEAYQERVPVVTYDDIREDIQAILDGESDVLFAGRPKLFLQSSGTTGEPKLLPESPLSAGVKYLTQTIRELYSGGTVAYTLRRNPRFLELAQRKGWEKGRDTGRKRIFADCHILPLVTASSPKAGQQKVKVDFASNQSARKSNTAPIIIYPMAITQINNKEAMMYLIMMFSLRYDDVVEVAGNHAGRLTAMVEYARDHAQEMIDDIRQGTISPRQMCIRDRLGYEGVDKKRIGQQIKGRLLLDAATR